MQLAAVSRFATSVFLFSLAQSQQSVNTGSTHNFLLQIMTRKEFEEALVAKNLAHHLDSFESVVRNCIRLLLTSEEEDLMPCGSSKIGGQPDLPPFITWPTEANGNPLSFIAQLNFSELSRLDKDQLLPKRGTLYFFYSAEQEAWGFDIKDKDKFKVIFYDGDTAQLSRVEYPDALDKYSKYTPCFVTPQQEISILPYSYFEERMKFLSREEGDIYWDIMNEGEVNKILGYADPIQNDMELECELVINGLYCGDSSGYDDPRAKGLEPNAINWRLLLQVDSNEDCEMMWGDSGRLYFWIREEDLRARNFDKSWFILQSY
ncbi:YwqG family protein [Hymenobacter jejuensis]|uniref:DUF1963 domain-containing protein n=1 Tax=Hymenobacter jejuensis TaxID=2502781 RepID=A0A5B7ZYL9_9BACT|nr:YwqG family protein [Hymenobacter jejuensis]QDA59543.1 DUF1963 domain-containing protein [Hymenobacter jejuensis]